jgi:hypothetical protein
LLEYGLSEDGWERLAGQVALVARVPPDQITLGTRVCDLDVDSLALSELAVLLITELGFDPLIEPGPGWEQLTFEQLRRRASGPRDERTPHALTPQPAQP